MTADWIVVVAVLAAALLHASWNAIAKSGSDPLLNVAAITVTSSLAAAALLPFVPLPERAAWPFLAASVPLHLLYQLALVRAYTLGDLSQVYPVARGLAPLGVAAIAAWAGEVPTALQAVGLVLASAAIASLAFLRGAPSAAASALPSALLTALFISGYTVVDGFGVRAAGRELSYIAWMFFLDGFPMLAVAAARRRGRLVAYLRRDGLRAAGGGLMAALGYGVVLWALARGPMAPVAALRETGVVFAALLGTRLLNEPLGPQRIAAACVLAAGLVLVQSQGV